MATPTLKPASANIAERLEELRAKRAKIKEGGGKQRIEKHHKSGKLTARERIDKLVDGESFQEIGLFAKHRATYFGMADKDLPADGVGRRRSRRSALRQNYRDDEALHEDGEPLHLCERFRWRPSAGRN